ncbi:hypothetical protein [Mesorhizobium sp. M0140]|uniref:NAD(P)/FAD-dependent oxidoreductase n=1 Tax=Mesorhizobium sp. M0140 TaxID=2956893 RepID=UPI00333A722D
MLEAGRHDRPKPGEVLPAVANGLLRQLGVWTPFAEAGFVENRALVSVWANEVPSERHGMFSAQGAGWQLDRTRFDRLMVQAAKPAGVDTRFGSAVGSAVRDDQGWLLKLADEAIVARRGLGDRSQLEAGAMFRRQAHHARTSCRLHTLFSTAHRAIAAWSSRRVPKAGGTAPTCACLTDPDLGSELRKAGHWRFSRNAVHRAARAAQRNRDRQHDQGGGNRNDRSRRR